VKGQKKRKTELTRYASTRLERPSILWEEKIVALGNTSDLKLSVQRVQNVLEFTQGREIPEVRVFMHIHADKIGDLNGAGAF